MTRTGFADGLFRAWRKDPPSSSTTRLRRRDRARRGTDFGTGSSREHAVWAWRLRFRVVVSPRFGDIFRGNASKAGLLPSSCPTTVGALQDTAEAIPTADVTVDLVAREVRHAPAPIGAAFEIDDYTRWRLMEGLDDIGLTLRHTGGIAAFEQSRGWLPVTA